MTTIENNKLIAEFMGYKELGGVEYKMPQHERAVAFTSTDGYFVSSIFKPDELAYHSSWNWLMEVVEKIEQLNIEYEGATISFDVTILYGDCRITDEDGNGDVDIHVHSNDSRDKLAATYEAVVSFINWYNKNK